MTRCKTVHYCTCNHVRFHLNQPGGHLCQHSVDVWRISLLAFTCGDSAEQQQQRKTHRDLHSVVLCLCFPIRMRLYIILLCWNCGLMINYINRRSFLLFSQTVWFQQMRGWPVRSCWPYVIKLLNGIWPDGKQMVSLRTRLSEGPSFLCIKQMINREVQLLSSENTQVFWFHVMLL